MTGDLTSPEETLGDRAHALVRAALGVIPYGGAAATELFNAFLMPPLQKRQREWMEQVAVALAELQDAGRIDLDALQQDERFISLLIEASTIAQKTHHAEKREALRNVVVNGAIDTTLDETLQHIFLRLIDELSPLHLQLLSLADDPAEFERRTSKKLPRANMLGSWIMMMEGGIQELKGQRDLSERLWNDLKQSGLVQGEVMMNTTPEGMWERRTKPLGRAFLERIVEPQGDE